MWVGPKRHHMYLYKDGSEGRIVLDRRGGGNVPTVRDFSDGATSQGMLAASRSWKREVMDSPERA